MGKIRVKTLGSEEEEAREKEAKKTKKAEKKARLSASEAAVDGAQAQQQGVAEVEGPNGAQRAIGEDNTPSEHPREETSDRTPSEEPADSEAETKKAAKKESKYAKKNKKAPRSVKYQERLTLIDKKKVYGLSEALELLSKAHLAQFDETVELHINTVSAGLSGNLNLPHGTGKQVRVAVASDSLIANVEKGKVDFDVLIAAPAMMPKLARVAKVLGPRGLMPNPKAGTVTDKTDEMLKKYQSGYATFKTEAKNPLIHLSVGKLSFGNEKLAENIKAAFVAIKTGNIQQVVLKSSMSPAIKIKA